MLVRSSKYQFCSAQYLGASLIYTSFCVHNNCNGRDGIVGKLVLHSSRYFSGME